MNTESSLPWKGAQVRTANPNSAVAFFAKRLLDISCGALLSLALFPLLPVIATLIKLDSPGPVFFKHKRVGARRRMRSGQPEWEVTHFPMFKFRSMVKNADQSLHEAHVLAFVEGRLTSPDSAKLEGDRRVTRVGKVLRRTSLDELPQLFNVLRGEMSLVGPRPVPPYEAAAYTEWQRERLAAMPGITGLWQVKGRGQSSFIEMVQLDIEYVRTRSFWLDVRLLLQTIPVLVSGRGAT